MNTLYRSLMDQIERKTSAGLKSTFSISKEMSEKIFVIPPNRIRYLSEIAENNRAYDSWVNSQVDVASNLDALLRTLSLYSNNNSDKSIHKSLSSTFEKLKMDIDPHNLKIIENWDDKLNKYT